jgi:hypothetical protein
MFNIKKDSKIFNCSSNLVQSCNSNKNINIEKFENVEQYAHFYVECNWNGQSSKLGIGKYNIGETGLPDKSISSISVPVGLKVRIFDNQDFSGESLLVHEDRTCLKFDRYRDGWYNWDKKISSIIIEKA